MSVTGSWTVVNPQNNQKYIAPAAYWFLPVYGTRITCWVSAYDSSGNLLTVSELEAHIFNVGGNYEEYIQVGSNCNTVEAQASTGGSRGDVFAPSGQVNQDGVASLRMYCVYTGTATDQPPNAPTNPKPTGGSVATSLTPTFTGSFTDPSDGDQLAQFEIVVNAAANGGGAQLWDSGALTASIAMINANQFSAAYGGSALAYGQTYSWRARMKNQQGNWGPYCGWQNFMTALGPNAPTAVTPAGLQTSTTPAFSFGYSSPAATAAASYRYTITQGSATIYNSGTITRSAASGTTISGTIASAAGLQRGIGYSFNVFATDTNGAPSPTTSAAFSIAVLPVAAPVSPVNNVTVSTHFPTFAWSYNDPNYAQKSLEVQVFNATTGASIQDSGVVTSAATTWTMTTSVAYGTQISWQVQVVDTAGLASNYTTRAFALVNNSPAAAITNPSAGGTIVTNTPTITWTYTAASGGYLEASASVTLLDTNLNIIFQSGTLSGAVTSYTLPTGILTNGSSYQIFVTVNDTNGATGNSSAVTFTLLYVAPADLQGQPLPSNKNSLLNPHLNSDINGDGVPDSWVGTVDAGVVAAFSDAPNTTQPWQMPSGDGFFTGGAQILVTARTATAYATISQTVNVATAGWTANTTRLSIAAFLQVFTNAGAPTGVISLKFLNSGGGTISEAFGSPQVTTLGTIQYTGPQNVLIPTGCTNVVVNLRNGGASGDLGGTIWFGVQLEAAAASDPNFIAGDMGTGYSFDAHGFSARTFLAGNTPSILANPGSDSDVVIGGAGGTMTLAWDPTLVDARFTNYIIERRRIDQQSDDGQWLVLSTMASTASSWTDYTCGGSTTYQYALRQQITYIDGSVGLSPNRAIVAGSVIFSPAWYLVNVSGLIYDLRLTKVIAKRTLLWHEQAQYTPFLGRIGQVRDAGQPLGYEFTLTCYFDDAFGDSRSSMRRVLVSMQQLNVLWYLKDSAGLVVPCTLGDVQFDEQDSSGDTLMTVQFKLLQAQETQDY